MRFLYLHSFFLYNLTSIFYGQISRKKEKPIFQIECSPSGERNCKRYLPRSTNYGNSWLMLDWKAGSDIMKSKINYSSLKFPNLQQKVFLILLTLNLWQNVFLFCKLKTPPNYKILPWPLIRPGPNLINFKAFVK